MKEQLDNFSGIIDNNNMKSDERYKFYEAYNNLDETFEEIKRNNPDYIKEERQIAWQKKSQNKKVLKKI